MARTRTFKDEGQKVRHSKGDKEMAIDITAKQKLVLWAINIHPEAANDDALLYAIVWRLEGWNDNRSLYENLKNVTRGETISRRRRELHDMGLISYSKESDKVREDAFKSELHNHSATSWLND